MAKKNTVKATNKKATIKVEKETQEQIAKEQIEKNEKEFVSDKQINEKKDEKNQDQTETSSALIEQPIENVQTVKMKEPIFLLSVVLWNQAKYLPAFLSSLRLQSEKRFVLCLIDNHSHDQTRDWLKQYDFTGIGLGVEVLRNFSNRGFGAAHNQVLKIKTVGEYIGILNADIVLPPNFLADILSGMKNHPETWLHGPRLQRCSWSAEAVAMDVQPKDLPVTAMIDFSTIVDSLGLKLHASGLVSERYGDSDWLKLKDQIKPAEVFGLTGACLFFPRSRLVSMYYPGTDGIFHPDFFAYQEDIELAWRVQELGGSAWCHSQIVAYHFRRYQGDSFWWRRIIKYFKRRGLVAQYSYRNHLRLLAEHYPWWKFFPYSVTALIFEWRVLFLILLGRFDVFTAWFSLLANTLTWWPRRRLAARNANFTRAKFIFWIRSH